MAINMNHTITLAIIGILLLSVAPWTDGALTCGAVAQSLVPCLNYFRGGGIGSVPPGCCNGIRSLNNNARTTPDRQTVCGCLKEAANSLRNINIGLAASIPPKCGVNIPYKLDPATDCSK
ncbi:non-specific lipid-transfer protein 1-like [Silene latifolia]|uniref:non-specific lipid-transfer protein 1-like n=1 Tax=Silene latifolia TaxID=37657 RepID=UPI003D77B743